MSPSCPCKTIFKITGLEVQYPSAEGKHLLRRIQPNTASHKAIRLPGIDIQMPRVDSVFNGPCVDHENTFHCEGIQC